MTPPSRRVLDATQSPTNDRRWSLSLECGHEQWVTAARRPIAKSSRCESCEDAADEPPAPPPRSADAIARDSPHLLDRPDEGSRCPRCHATAPNARGCALCAPEALERRLSAERRRVPLAPPPSPAEEARRRRVAKIRRIAERRAEQAREDDELPPEDR